MSTAQLAFNEVGTLQSLQASRKHLQFMLDLINCSAKDLNPRDLLDELLSCIRRVFKCDGAYIALFDPKDASIFREFACQFRWYDGHASQARLSSEEAEWLSRIILSGEPVTLAVPRSEIRAVAGQTGFRSQCYFPLYSRLRGCGVLMLGSLEEGAFAEEDLGFLQVVARQVAVVVENALGQRQIMALRGQLADDSVYIESAVRKAIFEEIVGSSGALLRTLEHVAKVAPTDSTVLISGESGTGKELIARAIHKCSRRKNHPFVRVNCAAIPQSLIASELFGHEKGAFTGANQRHLGRFELANEGTIFLDEVGDIPPETQIALLRVLQEREFERVGSCRPIPVNVRVLAATNRDLKAAVDAGTFRLDLFYRLNVFPVGVPPLRERADDIPLLTKYFIDRYAAAVGKQIRHIEKKTLDVLQAYHWPGNIRELQNVVERAVILCDGETFSVDESWFRIEEPRTASMPASFTEDLIRREKEMIEAALEKSRGRIFGPSGAAAKLGIPRSTLESRIKSLNINKYRFKAEERTKAAVAT